jgi:hypothetical protein
MDTDIYPLITNRNQFVIDYSIKSKWDRIPQYVIEQCGLYDNQIGRWCLTGKLFDHIESYKTLDGRYVLVNSPYYPPNKEEKLLELGWVRYINLYAPESIQSSTYIFVADARTRR